MTGLVQWGMRQSAEISNQLVSVERVLEYTKVESEENLEKASTENGMELEQASFQCRERDRFTKNYRVIIYF